MTLYKWSQIASADATADSTINWAEGQVPSSVNDSARAMMAATAKFRDDTNGSLVTGGTSTAFTITSNQGFDTLAHLDKQTLTITMNATSGATPTLNVDSLGAKPIRHATGAILPTGALLSASVYRATYFNTAGEFLISDQLAAQPANSVVTASITDANVTYAKIQNVAADSLIGNSTGSSAVSTDVGLVGPLVMSGSSVAIGATTTAHGVALWEGTNAMGNTGAGTLGQALISGGGSADPSYKSGAWVLLNTLTANNSATTIGDSSSFGSYNEILVVIENLLPQTNATTARFQVHSNGGFQNTNYICCLVVSSSSSSTPTTINDTTGIPLTAVTDWGNTGTGISGEVTIFNATNSAQAKSATIHVTNNLGSVALATVGGGFWNGANTAIDGFQIIAASGNIASGVVKIYGRL